MKKNLLLVLALLISVSFAFTQSVVSFENLSLEPESHYAGEDGQGGFDVDYLRFYNSFTDWGGGMSSWNGFAYSNETDNTSYNFTNQFSSAAGSGVNNSENFVVSYVDADWMNNYEPIPAIMKINKENQEDIIPGMFLSLNTYASLYMADNDLYKTEKHWFKLKIVALSTSSYFGTQAEFILADYRSDEEDLHFKFNDWTYVDLSWIEIADSLLFYIYSSDSGDYGINTPAYFCIDNFADTYPENIPEFKTDIKTDYYINSGETVKLNAFVKGGVQPYSFEWSNYEVLDQADSQTPIANVTENTSLTLVVKDAKGNSKTETVNIWLDATNISENKTFEAKVYFNQNNILNIDSEKEINSLKIFDITGKQIPINFHKSNNVNIDLSFLPQGVYIIRLSDGISSYSTKIVK